MLGGERGVHYRHQNTEETKQGRKGDASRNQSDEIVQGLGGHCKDFGFYSECNGKLLEDFESKDAITVVQILILLLLLLQLPLLLLLILILIIVSTMQLLLTFNPYTTAIPILYLNMLPKIKHTINVRT